MPYRKLTPIDAHSTSICCVSEGNQNRAVRGSLFVICFAVLAVSSGAWSAQPPPNWQANYPIKPTRYEPFTFRPIYEESTTREFSEFRKPADFSLAIFAGGTHFFGTTFWESATFHNATFRPPRPAQFTKTIFHRDASFEGTRFLSGLDFTSVTMDSLSAIRFDHTVFNLGIQFRSCNIANWSFTDCLIKSDSILFFDGDTARTMSFQGVRFESPILFGRCSIQYSYIQECRFSSWVTASGSDITLLNADWSGNVFDSTVDLTGVYFGDSVEFAHDSRLNKRSDHIFIDRNLFRGAVRFGHNYSELYFLGCRFESGAVFHEIDDRLYFREDMLGDPTTLKPSALDFRYCDVKADIVFDDDELYGNLNFVGSQFERTKHNTAYGTLDSGKIDMHLTYLNDDSLHWVLFGNSRVYDTVRIGGLGTRSFQNFDFSLAIFPSRRGIYRRSVQSGWAADSTELAQIPMRSNLFDSLQLISTVPVHPKIILAGTVRLKLQLEKFDYLALDDTLSYFEKRNIIDYLKESSYSGPNFAQERLELDYLLAKSTAGQRVSTVYEKLPWYSPTLWMRELYYLTLGYGYRPFRLVFWALGILMAFAMVYLSFYGGDFCRQVATYVARLADPKAKWDGEVWQSLAEAVVYCVWFSATILFALRLKPGVLVHFTPREKKWIIGEYLAGLALYALFVFLSKAGSIWSTVIHLVTG